MDPERALGSGEVLDVPGQKMAVGAGASIVSRAPFHMQEDAAKYLGHSYSEISCRRINTVRSSEPVLIPLERRLFILGSWVARSSRWVR